MRKAISCIMCLAILLLSMPGYALASDGARQTFIENYLHIMDKSLEMQNVYMEDMQRNTIQLNFDGELTESSYQGADGTIMSEVPCNGSLEIIGNQKNGQCQVNFGGQVLEYVLDGTLYLSKDGIIIPKATIESLAKIDAEGLLGLDDLEDMPAYVVFQPFQSDEEWALLQESFTYNTEMYSKKNEIKAFYRELLDTIPASCFRYEDGYAVLDLQPSILGSAVFINNLKNNSQDLAEKFTAIMTQPPYVSDEEFAAMKEEIEVGIVTGIDSIQISDLADLELPFTVEEFKILTKYDVIDTSIHINGDVEGSKINLNLTSSGVLTGSSNCSSQVDIALLIDSPDMFMDLALHGQGTSSASKSDMDITVAGDLRSGEVLLSGKIDFETSMDFDSESRINIPEINENNSMVIDMADFMPDQPEWNSEYEMYGTEDYDDGKLKIFLYGYQMDFGEAEPVIINSCTMVPVREIGENLYCEVSWQPPDTVIFSDGYSEEDLILKINSTTYYVGDQSYTTDTVPVIINGHTYVPLRAVADYLGYTLDWDAASKSVFMEFDY